MAVLEGAQANTHDPSGTCRGCGTDIPLSDLILEKFRRCYYCGKADPLGADWRNLLVLVILTMLAMWSKHAPL